MEKFCSDCPGIAEYLPDSYRSVLDTIFCGILIFDENGLIIHCNKAAAGMLLSPQPRGAVPEPFLPLLDPFCQLLSESVDLARGVGRYQIDYDERRFVCNVHPWVMEGARRGTIVIFHESMHSNCIAQEMDVTSGLLQEINIFLETSHDGFLVTDAKGTVIRVNAAFERAFSVERRDVIGRNVADLVVDGIYSQSAALRVIETQETATVIIDKGAKRIMATGTPAFDPLGVFTSVVVNVRDITELEDLQERLRHQLTVAEGYAKELTYLKHQSRASGGVIASSRDMKRILDTIKAISTVDSTVLITGESGTGKEVVVDQIYQTSLRSDKPIIKINCGAIPSGLFESEMFGYEDGAFTGARKKGKAGFFELADNGTLFLDEVGELDSEVQVKLLRVIQEGELTRIGGSRAIHVDVRIIAATNRDLWKLIEEGRFRQDLYYRLNVISIEIPPLRQRRDDIIPLTMQFLERYNRKYQKHKEISMALGKILHGLDWPGNIRELENLIENMVVLVQDDVLMPHDLPQRYQKSPVYESQIVVNGILPLHEAVEQLETQLLRNAQERYTTTREIAQALGVNQSTVSRKMAQRSHQ